MVLQELVYPLSIIDASAFSKNNTLFRIDFRIMGKHVGMIMAYINVNCFLYFDVAGSISTEAISHNGSILGHVFPWKKACFQLEQQLLGLTL